MGCKKEITSEEIKTIQSLLEEIRLHRNDEDEPREMAMNGLYEEEWALVKKLGISLDE